MDCNEVQELLSAFYDDELSSETRLHVQEHIGRCARCAEELADFQRLTSMTETLGVTDPPREIWDRLESALDAGGAMPPARSPGRRQSTSWSLALVATLLVAACLGSLVVFFSSDHREHGELVEAFGHYVDRFHENSEDAQDMLLAMFDGVPVDPEKAIHLAGFRPATADRMPAGYNTKATYVLKMPCCTCVQTVCQRSNGTKFAIFEHEDEHREWLGERRMDQVECNGKQCMLCNIDDRIAGTWQRGRRHITMIGLQDQTEFEALISWLDNDEQPNSS